MLLQVQVLEDTRVKLTGLKIDNRRHEILKGIASWILMTVICLACCIYLYKEDLLSPGVLVACVMTVATEPIWILASLVTPNHMVAILCSAMADRVHQVTRHVQTRTADSVNFHVLIGDVRRVEWRT